MTLSEAQARISNAVYDATKILEQLEVAGLIQGNGHHARQAIAAFAVKELTDRWQNRRTVEGMRDGDDLRAN